MTSVRAISIDATCTISGLVGGPSLQFVNLRDRRRVERVRAQAVDRLGGKRDQFAGANASPRLP